MKIKTLIQRRLIKNGSKLKYEDYDPTDLVYYIELYIKDFLKTREEIESFFKQANFIPAYEYGKLKDKEYNLQMELKEIEKDFE